MYKTKFNTGDKSISKESLRMVENYFRKNNERLMPFKQISTDFRTDMKIMDSIVKVFNIK